MNEALVRAVRRELKVRGDPSKAEPMRAYMKSEMPYRGVQTPAQRAIHRDVFAKFPMDDADTWMATVLDLWRSAAYREERYAAISLSAYKLYDSYQTMATLPMYEEMIVTGAWWDYVDSIATHSLRLLLERFPPMMKRKMRSWSRSPDMWKRRSAILCQVGRKAETDLVLLYDCIRPNLAGREFFIRKAIGWALREYAWTDPGEIARFVREHQTELSPLSRREALKNIGRNK